MMGFRKAQRVIDLTLQETTTAELEGSAAALTALRDKYCIRAQFLGIAATAEPHLKPEAEEAAVLWAQLDQVTRAAQNAVTARKKAATR